MIKDRTKCRIAYSFMIIGFIILNYVIIGHAHSLLYEPDVYVCRHMSQDIEDQLEYFGLPVTIVRAANHDNSEAHMWVRVLGVEFDSVYLIPYYSFTYTEDRTEFVDYDDYLDSKENHEVR